MSFTAFLIMIERLHARLLHVSGEYFSLPRNCSSMLLTAVSILFELATFPLSGPSLYVFSYLTLGFMSSVLLTLTRALLIRRMPNSEWTELATPLKVDLRLFILSELICACALVFDPSSEDFAMETRRCCLQTPKTSSSLSSLVSLWNITFCMEGTESTDNAMITSINQIQDSIFFTELSPHKSSGDSFSRYVHMTGNPYIFSKKQPLSSVPQIYKTCLFSVLWIILDINGQINFLFYTDLVEHRGLLFKWPLLEISSIRQAKTVARNNIRQSRYIIRQRR